MLLRDIVRTMLVAWEILYLTWLKVSESQKFLMVVNKAPGSLYFDS